MAELNTDVRYIKGVGEARAKALAKLGIHTLQDLVMAFPRAYEDRTVFKPISDLIVGETVCVRAAVASPPQLRRIRRGLDLVKLRAVDERGSLGITFFNQSYVRDALIPGESYVFYGRVGGLIGRPEMTNPVFEKEEAEGRVTGRITPIYRLTAGISQNMMARCVAEGLAACGDVLPDPLPRGVQEAYQLAQSRFSYENIHFPKDFKELELARRRLIFEEFFVLSCALDMFREKRSVKAGYALKKADLETFYAALPFRPTGAQRRAVAEAVADMESGRPMDRLLQGDVGSGKTLVAAACCWYAWRSGHQSAFMAPTEILVEQHYKTLSSLLSPFGMRVDRLTGGMTAKEKTAKRRAAAAGETDLLIGTHALITGDVAFSDLALVIADEQHRFGVQQRMALAEKADSPHVLVMSATPIPRTLALIVYGDMDVSVLDELPPGREKVDTFAVDEDMRPRIHAFMKKLIDEGRQVFVVCPAVEENEDWDAEIKNVKDYTENLRREFPAYRVALVHGKMKAKEKDAAMAAFVGGETDILVATTVIEVGVDVPNAALMVVENAERFGLSQLHQLRGRVGRGPYKSYCVLFNGGATETGRERLKAMCRTNDGFKIAEADLQLRGPGDFFGSRQSGLPEMHIANFATDMELLKSAQNAARDVLRADPELDGEENKRLREHVLRLLERSANSL